MLNNLTKRWLFFVTGLIILSFGISLMVKGQTLGLGSWDVLHLALTNKIGFTMGIWSMIVGFIIISVSWLITKERPKLGVFVNMFSCGIFIDFFNSILPEVKSFPAQLFVYLLGVAILSFGIAFYISPDLGAGPRDSLMLLIVDKTPLSLRMTRNLLELFAVVLGFLLGGPVGLGTVLVVTMLGTFIQWMLPITTTLLNAFLTGEVIEPSSH